MYELIGQFRYWIWNFESQISYDPSGLSGLSNALNMLNVSLYKDIRDLTCVRRPSNEFRLLSPAMIPVFSIRPTSNQIRIFLITRSRANVLNDINLDFWFLDVLFNRTKQTVWYIPYLCAISFFISCYNSWADLNYRI